MTSNVKACMPSEIYKLLLRGWPGLAKTCKNNVSFLKKMVVNRYSNHVLLIFNCMPQHYILTMYCYKLSTTNDNYAALQKNPKARNYSDIKVSQHGKETVCKFQSNIKDI